MKKISYKTDDSGDIVLVEHSEKVECMYTPTGILLYLDNEIILRVTQFAVE
jgi:hypothetical protein